MVDLRDKMLNSHHPVIFYEITPPQEKAKASTAEAYIQCAVELIDSSAKEFVDELGAVYTHSFETKYNIFD